MIQYNVTVQANLYAKYYFELRALFRDNEREFPIVPLDKHEAEKLEIESPMFGSLTNRVEVEERLNSSFGETPTVRSGGIYARIFDSETRGYLRTKSTDSKVFVGILHIRIRT